jgi:hypothetical protein
LRITSIEDWGGAFADVAATRHGTVSLDVSFMLTYLSYLL